MDLKHKTPLRKCLINETQDNIAFCKQYVQNIEFIFVTKGC